MLGTSVGLLGAGAVGWASDHRYVISEWMVLLLGCCILVLALMRSRRRALGWQPRVVLGEWFEFPIQRQLAPVAVPVTESAVDALNRRGAAAAAALGPAAATWIVNFLIWTRDVFIAGAAARQADVQAILNAQAIGWFGALPPGPEESPAAEEDEDSDRLAS